MSAVTLTATALAAAVLGCLAVGALGQVAVARAEADGAADLAALAVASQVVRGEPSTSACAVAATVAGGAGTDPGPGVPGGPGAVVTACRVDGEVVTVSVRRDLDVLGVTVPVLAAARAGPVGP